MLIYKIYKKIIHKFLQPICKMNTYILFVGNGVKHKKFHTNGIPYVMVARGGKCVIGENFTMNNRIEDNPIGSYRKCTFLVDRNATLIIGENVGISQTALICHKSITIGNNVKIGGGVSRAGGLSAGGTPVARLYGGTGLAGGVVIHTLDGTYLHVHAFRIPAFVVQYVMAILVWGNLPELLFREETDGPVYSGGTLWSSLVYGGLFAVAGL